MPRRQEFEHRITIRVTSGMLQAMEADAARRSCAIGTLIRLAIVDFLSLDKRMVDLTDASSASEFDPYQRYRE